MLQPGMENDARKMAKVEDTLLQCMSKTVDEHISMLQPMQDRECPQRLQIAVLIGVVLVLDVVVTNKK
jgi:hypothetical protein